jgi:hypothetical protein
MEAAGALEGTTVLCHECWMEGLEAPAVALCRHCSVALCKAHLVASFRGQPGGLGPCCRHRPDAPAHPAAVAAAAPR